MIFVDTNIFTRLLVKDDAGQHGQAKEVATFDKKHFSKLRAALYQFNTVQNADNVTRRECAR